MQKHRWDKFNQGTLEFGHLWKGALTPVLREKWTLASESFPVFKVQLCPCPLVPWRGEGKTLVSGAAGAHNPPLGHASAA